MRGRRGNVHRESNTPIKRGTWITPPPIPRKLETGGQQRRPDQPLPAEATAAEAAALSADARSGYGAIDVKAVLVAAYFRASGCGLCG
jgi:hypothetical protein